ERVVGILVAGLGRGRHVGQRRRALRRAHRERHELALPNERQCGGDGRASKVDAPGYDLGEYLGHPAERDLQGVKAGAEAQYLGGDVGRRADAGSAKGDRAGLALAEETSCCSVLMPFSGATTVRWGELPKAATAAKSLAVS